MLTFSLKRLIERLSGSEYQLADPEDLVPNPDQIAALKARAVELVRDALVEPESGERELVDRGVRVSGDESGGERVEAADGDQVDLVG